MATPDVITYHKDGGINFSEFKYDRIHAKVGEAEGGNANQIYLMSNYNQAKNLFVKGALLDSLKQYYEEFDQARGQKPVPVLCVRPVNDTAGSIATPVKGAGNIGEVALPTISGTPTGSRTVILKITKDGAHQTAEYRKSTDGGETFGSPLITPASGSAISLDVGVSTTFVNSSTPANTFKTGDTFTFAITGPSASVSSKLTAIEALMEEYRLYSIHLVGGLVRSVAVSCAQILEEMRVAKKLPTYIILEGQTIATGQTEAQYYQGLLDEWDPFFHDRVCIVTAEGKYIPGGIEAFGGYSAVNDQLEIIGEWRNAATFLTAKLASAPPNVSAGYVMEMRSLTFATIRHWKTGYQDYMDAMHDSGLTVLKIYPDFEGVYIAKDKIKSAPDSDFKEIPERRRADKMHRILYRESLPFLGQDTEANSGSGGLDFLKATIDSKISEEMEAQGRAEISGHEIKLDPDNTFKNDKILKAKLKMFIKDRITAIEWETSFAVAK
ncbi:MAG: hypothetical protein HS129_15055 [Leptospiraceae bacterium]|nr:hypothetical protein [Leptospiraceae bacterium]